MKQKGHSQSGQKFGFVTLHVEYHGATSLKQTEV